MINCYFSPLSLKFVFLIHKFWKCNHLSPFVHKLLLKVSVDSFKTKLKKKIIKMILLIYIKKILVFKLNMTTMTIDQILCLIFYCFFFFFFFWAASRPFVSDLICHGPSLEKGQFISYVTLCVSHSFFSILNFHVNSTRLDWIKCNRKSNRWLFQRSHTSKRELLIFKSQLN